MAQRSSPTDLSIIIQDMQNRLRRMEQPVRKRVVPEVIHWTSANTPHVVLQDAATNSVSVMLPVPTDWQGGDITCNFIVRSGAGSGNVRLQWLRYRFRNGIAYVGHDGGFETVAITTNNSILSRTYATSEFQIDDVLRWDITRIGADGADTLASVLAIDGVWCEYLGLP